MKEDRLSNSKSLLRVILILMLLAVLPVATMAQSPDSPSVAQDATPEKPASEQLDGQPTESVENPKQDPKTKPKKLEFTKQVVVYQTIDGAEPEQLKCDIYTPQGEGPFPAILAVHGGAWRQGTKFAMLRHAWKMAQSGYVVVSINYRHAPKHPFPAQIHDCKHAIRWMRSNAEKYKIDPERIGAFGYSAGGHLVSLLGTSDKEDGLEGPVEKEFEKFDTRVKAVAAGGAPCEFSWLDKDSKTLSYWLGGSRDQKPETYRAASPTTFVSADDPAFFFFHGDSDLLVPASSPQALHDLLEKAGVKSEFHTAKKGGHLGTFTDIRWMEQAIVFFDKHLKDQEGDQKKEGSDKPKDSKPELKPKLKPKPKR